MDEVKSKELWEREAWEIRKTSLWEQIKLDCWSFNVGLIVSNKKVKHKKNIQITKDLNSTFHKRDQIY